MSKIRRETINNILNKAYTLTYNKNDLDKTYESRKKIIFDETSLTKEEKSEAIRLLNKYYDYNKIHHDNTKKRICNNCERKCLATLYCEYCIKDYLKSNFLNWTSADWIEGNYKKWDLKDQQLKRSGTKKVILKKLVNVELAKENWFEEAKSHLMISNRWNSIAKCYGLTQNPLTGNYMLIMKQYDMDLKRYLQQNNNQFNWKERIKIIIQITKALSRIHKENISHKNLHSGNILYSHHYNYWYISDLGFCNPADKPLKSIYGNLSYIAPEVISGKEYSLASDIYSLSMLMWEISSGQPPFINYENGDYYLAINIVNGMRPKFVSGTPENCKKLMEKCWNADPSKRFKINKFKKRITEINKSFYNQKEIEIQKSNINSIDYNRKLCSKMYSFNDIPEPKNATKEQQHEFHCTQ
ncbi:Ipl1p [Rhizophagus irregularis DAOM 197198w]|uniref:Ipl1p n=2 Tax=Rhizophagus irregularis TaxID=588596 RepID=A0A015HZT2_RHIIW|nr:Ipl1p [Rhizophagus irregularis DAOM 197198w]